MDVKATQPHRSMLVTWTSVLVTTATLAVAASLFTWWMVSHANCDVCLDLVKQVQPIANAVNIDRIRSLSGSLADLGNPDYRRLKEQLAAICSANPEYRYVYLMGRKADGAVFFFVDAGEGDEAEPGEIYTDVPEAMRRVFDTAYPATVGPYSDQWGTFVSGAVPLVDSATGNVTAVLGIDVDARDWKWNVIAEAALPVGLMLALAAVVGAGIATLRRRPAASPRPIQRRLIVPFAVVFVALLVGFGMAIAGLHRRHLATTSFDVLNRSAAGLSAHAALQADALAILEDTMVRDAGLRKALKDADRQRLLDDWKPVFKDLREKHGVTHVCFLDPKRVCLLSLDDPTEHGKRIERFTALEAERTGATVAGTELGTHGALTLQVVCPVFDDATLIGYLELGKEIETSLTHVHAAHGVELVVDIRKSLLDRERWQAGAPSLERDAAWDRFPDDVVIYSSLSPLPAALTQFIEHRGRLKTNANEDLQFNGRRWHLLATPLRDASGEHVGDLLVLHDVTAPIMALRRVVLLAAGAAVVVLVMLRGAVHVLLHRTDMDILAQQAALRESEGKYRELVENANAIIYSLDRQGVLTYASPNWSRLLGDQVDAVVGRSFSEFVHPDDLPVWLDVLHDVFESGLERAGIEFRLCDGNRNWFWHATSTSPVCDAAGLVTSCIGVSRDITKRKNAEAALRESEQRLAATLRSIGDAVITCDREGRVTSLNEVASALTGWTLGEAAGRPVGEVFHVVDSHTRADVAMDRALCEGGPIGVGDHTLLVARRDAEVRIADSCAPIRDDAGRVMGAVLVFRDVTEEQRRREALLESERRLQAIVDGSPIPQFVIDKDHRVTHWNQAIAKYSGIRAEEILGTTEAWRAFYDQQRPCLANLVLDGMVGSVQEWYDNKCRRSPLIDGAYEATGFFANAWGGVWLDFTAAPMRDAEGVIIGAVETLIDVTERKRAESLATARARFSTALNQMDAGAVYESALQVIATETDAPLVAVFEGDEESLTVRCVVGVDSKILDNASLSPEGLPRTVAATGDTITIDGPFDDLDLRLQFGLGEVALESIVGWPIRFQGRSVGVLLTVLIRPLADEQAEFVKTHLGQLAVRMRTIQIDTERSRLLANLQAQAKVLERARAAAERANLAKSTFLANMSHEFRTPMNAVLGFTTRLMAKKAAEPMSERDLEAVKIVDRNARQLLELITGILALSRIEAGKMELSPSRFDLRDVIDAVTERAVALAEARGLEIATEVPEVPLLVEADRVKIIQVLNNLVTNAVKYTNKGSVTVTATRAEDDCLGTVARVAVRDTGIGIKPEDLGRVFMMFTQIDAVRRGVGTGLGLPVAQQYARLHGGRIDVVSEFGKGSEFTLVLPLEPLLAPASEDLAQEVVGATNNALVET